MNIEGPRIGSEKYAKSRVRFFVSAKIVGMGKSEGSSSVFSNFDGKGVGSYLNKMQ